MTKLPITCSPAEEGRGGVRPDAQRLVNDRVEALVLRLFTLAEHRNPDRAPDVVSAHPWPSLERRNVQVLGAACGLLWQVA